MWWFFIFFIFWVFFFNDEVENYLDDYDDNDNSSDCYIYNLEIIGFFRNRVSIVFFIIS